MSKPSDHEGEPLARDKMTTAVGSVLAFIAFLWVSGVLPRFGATLYTAQYKALFLGLLLSLIFVKYPLRKGVPRDKLPWYDVLFILGSVACCGYQVFFPSLVEEHYAYGLASNLEIILGICLLIVMLEGGRRVIGLAMPLVVLFFILHPFVGSVLPGVLYSRSFSLARVFQYLYLSADGIFGLPLHIAATIIILFVLFGSFLQATGVGKFIVDLGLSIAGRWRGGPAKVSVFTSAAFGMVSGSVSANVVVDGVITIPLMIRTGYKPYYAAAVEASTSKGGQIMPPVMGTVAFLIAEILAIPYWKVCIYSAVPAIIFFAAIFWQIDFEAGKLGMKGLPKAELPNFMRVLKDGWIYFLPILVLCVCLFVLQYRPEKSAAFAILGTILMTFFKKESRLTPNKIATAIVDGAGGTLSAGIACGLAGVIIGSTALTSFGLKLSGSMLDLAGGHLFILLLLAAVASFILGMGMSSLPCYIMVSVMLAPAVIKLGVLPIAAHLFVFWWSLLSWVTPPVAIAVYIACSIAGPEAGLWRTGLQAVKLSMVAFVLPFMFCYNPELLLIGKSGGIAITIVTAFLGVILLAGALENYLWLKTNPLQRLLLLVGGLLLILPIHSFVIPGIVIGLIPVIWQWLKMRQSRFGEPSRKG